MCRTGLKGKEPPLTIFHLHKDVRMDPSVLTFSEIYSRNYSFCRRSYLKTHNVRTQVTMVYFLKIHISTWPNISLRKCIFKLKIIKNKRDEFGLICFVNQVFYFLDHVLPSVWLKILLTDQCFCVSVAQQMSWMLRPP